MKSVFYSPMHSIKPGANLTYDYKSSDTTPRRPTKLKTTNLLTTVSFSVKTKQKLRQMSEKFWYMTRTNVVLF